MIEHKNLAEHYGLELIAYEAGQHYAPGNNFENTKLTSRINRSLKMEEIHKEYIGARQEAGGIITILLAVANNTDVGAQKNIIDNQKN